MYLINNKYYVKAGYKLLEVDVVKNIDTQKYDVVSKKNYLDLKNNMNYRNITLEEVVKEREAKEEKRNGKNKMY